MKRSDQFHGSEYRGKRKKRHTPKGELSLAAECLRDGTIDVELTSGVVISFAARANRPATRHVMKLRTDPDGYQGFHLNRERKQKRGNPERDRKILRYRRRMYVQVHRLAYMKKVAILWADFHGGHWREHVVDLPRGIDVDHVDLNRSNNTIENLRLRTLVSNRQRRPMTEEEAATVADWENVF